MLQAKPGRSGKKEQQQNSPNLGTAFCRALSILRLFKACGWLGSIVPGHNERKELTSPNHVRPVNVDQFAQQQLGWIL